jgi:hypothetical protein
MLPFGLLVGWRLRHLKKVISLRRYDPSQLEKAQDLARECVRKKYKGC